MSDISPSPTIPPTPDSTPPVLGRPTPATPPVSGLGHTPGSLPTDQDWRTVITDENLRANPSIVNLNAKDANEAINALSHQLVHAQGMVGAEKVLRPKEDWTPEQHRDWRSEVLGNPKDAEGYKLTTLKLPEGVTEVPKEFKEAYISQVALLHGMSDAAAAASLEFILNSDAQMAADNKVKTDAMADKQLLELKTKWGDQYEAQMQVAEFGLQNAGHPDLVKMIADDPILRTHPLLTDLFYKVGQMLQSDKPSGLIEQQAPLGSKAQALQAIKEIEESSEYLKYINPKTTLDPTERMKKDSLLARRTELHMVAYGSEATAPV